MALADGMEPLVLADGTMIDPSTGKVMRPRSNNYVEVPSATQAIKQITAVRRTVADLPMPPQQMNAVSLVCMYHMFGMTDDDIAIATYIPAEQIGRIKMLDAFTTMLNNITDTILAQDMDDVRNMIAAKAKNAVAKVIDTMEGEDGVLGFKAAQDILDRAGHRPVDIVEHRMKLEGGLTIEYVKKDSGAGIPTIDVDYKELQ